MKKKFNQIMSEALSGKDAVAQYNAYKDYYRNRYQYDKTKNTAAAETPNTVIKKTYNQPEATFNILNDDVMKELLLTVMDDMRIRSVPSKIYSIKAPDTSSNFYNDKISKNDVQLIFLFLTKLKKVFDKYAKPIADIRKKNTTTVNNDAIAEEFRQIISKRYEEIENLANEVDMRSAAGYDYLLDAGILEDEEIQCADNWEMFCKQYNIDEMKSVLQSIQDYESLDFIGNSAAMREVQSKYFGKVKKIFQKYEDSLRDALTKFNNDGKKDKTEIKRILIRRTDDIYDLNEDLMRNSELLYKILVNNNILLRPDEERLPYLTYQQLINDRYSTLDDKLSGQESHLVFGSLLENISNLLELNASAINAANGHANAAGKLASQAKRDAQKGIQTPAAAHQKEMEARRQQADAAKVSRELQVKDQLSGESIKEDAATQLSKNIEIAQNQLQAVQNQQATVNGNLEQRKEITNKRFEARKNQLSKRIETLKDATERAKAMNDTVKQTTNEAMNTKEPEKSNSEVVSTDTKAETSINGVEAEKISSKENDDELNEAFNLDAYMLRKDFEKMLYNGASGNILKYFMKKEISLSREDQQVVKAMSGQELDICLKKMNYYLSRHRDYLRYDEYINLKVEKSKFKSIYEKAKKEIQNKYKK